MVKKLHKQSTDKKKASAKLPRLAKDSAQQIWLAGLGAFSKAQEEGGKVFEALVHEGLTIQRKTKAAAEEKIAAATNRVTDIANDMGSRAAGRWDKLENIFEDRVAKALSRLGVPSAREVQALNARIDALTQGQGKAAPKVTAKAAAKPAAKAPAKKSAAAAPVKKVAVKAAPRKAAAKPAAKAAAKPVAKAAASNPAAKPRAARTAQPTAPSPSAPAAPSTPSAS